MLEVKLNSILIEDKWPRDLMSSKVIEYEVGNKVDYFDENVSLKSYNLGTLLKLNQYIPNRFC